MLDLHADLADRHKGVPAHVLGNGPSRKTFERPGPCTVVIGCNAAYRDLEQARWRVVLPVKPNAPNAFIVRLGKADITVSEPATERKGSADQSKFDF